MKLNENDNHMDYDIDNDNNKTNDNKDVKDEPDNDDGNDLHLCNNMYCKNTCIQTRTFPLTEVMRTDTCGFGLRLLEDIEADTMICEYLGEVITPEECTNRMATYDLGDDFYFASLGQGLMLDAKTMGSIARFANHSCDPNCELQKWMVLGEPHICLVSTTKLLKGTEITYNYQYFQDGMEEISKLKRQKCHCGAASCAGTIGGKVRISASDVWLSKANSLLHSSKRYPLETFQLHISDEVINSNNVSSSCVEIQKIKGVIGDGLKWIRDLKRLIDVILIEKNVTLDLGVLGKLGKHNSSLDFTQVFDNIDITDISILTVDIVQELLEKIPKCLKLQEAVYLDQLKDRCIRTNRYILSYEESLNKQEAQEVAVPGSPKSLAVHIRWEDVVVIIKDIYACLPMKVDNGNKIMELYQDLSNWCLRWLSGLNKSHVIPDGGVRKLDSLSWNTIDAISKVYSLDLTDDAFVSTDFLDERLYLYMKRIGLVKGDWKEKLEGMGKKSQELVGTSDDNKQIDLEDMLHCFCCMPETEGETLTFSQCDSCDRWFHPQCLNLTVTSVGQKTKVFNCPLCLHRSNLCSAYIEAPSTEWKISRKAIKQDVVKCGTNAQIRCRSKKSNPVEIRTLDDMPVVKEESMTRSGGNECSLLKKKSDAKNYIKRISKSVTSDTLNVQEIEMALADDKLGLGLHMSNKRTIVTGSPPQLLLNMILKFTQEWIQKSTAFIESDELKAFYGLLQTISNETCTVTQGGGGGIETLDPLEVDDTILLHEVTLLEKCLNLYFELRLLRVKTPEVINLRRIVWLISSKTLITSKKNERVERVKPQLIDLRRALEGGVKLTMQDEATFKLIESVVLCADRYISQGLKCSKDESAAILNCFQNFEWVSFDKEYSYARVRSLALASKKQAKKRHETHDEKVDDDDKNNITANIASSKIIPDGQQQQPELFCYCQEPDYQGSKYIQCDGCEEWFHFECTGANNKKKLKEMKHYICIACSEERNEIYCYIW
jgi:hypothetical protein